MDTMYLVNDLNYLADCSASPGMLHAAHHQRRAKVDVKILVHRSKPYDHGPNPYSRACIVLRRDHEAASVLASPSVSAVVLTACPRAF